MAETKKALNNKAPWLVAALFACWVAQEEYHAWQRYRLSRELWTAVQGCRAEYAPNADASACNPATVQKLLARGANVHYTQGEDSESIFLQTQRFGQREFAMNTTPAEMEVDPMRRFYARVKPVRDAVSGLLLDAWIADHARRVRLSADQEQKEGKQACNLAIDLDRPNLIAPLLDSGVHVELTDLLTGAVSEAQPDLVKDLARRGAALTSTRTGSTLLMFACCCDDKPGKLETVKFLVEQGADVNLCYGSRSVLCTAASHDPAVVEYLLARGARVNTQSGSGRTALMEAVSSGQEANVRTLLAHGADPALKTDKGETALSVALRCKYANIVRLLEQAGART